MWSRLFLCTVSLTACWNAQAQTSSPQTQASAWNTIAPYFQVPATYANDYGNYASPLATPDGETIATAAEWAKQRENLFQEWTNRLGPWPPIITQPEIEILATDDVEQLKRYKIRFRWLPDSPSRTVNSTKSEPPESERFTTGYLLVPPNAQDCPAVLTVYYEPETAIGQGNPHRDFALQLAKRGFVALSIGTTVASDDKTYSLYYPSIHDANVQPLSMLGYAAANAWHVLAALPEVDSKRIGIVGHSFGGKWALFAAALFDRFAAVAVSDPGIVFSEHPSVNYWEPWYLGWHAPPWRTRGSISQDNPAFGIYPKLIEQGRDLHELHALIAPRPFFVSGGEVDPPERWRPLNHLVELNRVLGFENRVGMSNRPEHSPNAESNELIYAFFEHFLERPSQPAGGQ